MSETSTCNSERHELDRALQISTELYSSMLLLLKRIAAAAAENESNVKILLDKLRDQQRRIEEADSHLNSLLEPFLRTYPDALTSYALLEKRIKIMREVQQMNDLLLPKISGMMSLVSHEIGELKGGRNAISGYRAQGEGKTSKRHYTA